MNRANDLQRHRQWLTGSLLALWTAGSGCGRFGFEVLPIFENSGGGGASSFGGEGDGASGTGAAGGNPGTGAEGGAGPTGVDAAVGPGAGGGAETSGDGGLKAGAADGEASGPTDAGDAGNTRGAADASRVTDAGRPTDTGGSPDASESSCFDGLRNQNESAVDCGGVCAPCACAYGTPEELGAPNRPNDQLFSPSLTGDGLQLFFALVVIGFPEAVAVATRGDTSSPFGPSQVVPAPVAAAAEGNPFIHSNGLSLYFFSTRNGPDRDLFRASRATPGGTFDTVSELSSLNSSFDDHLPWVSQDELQIYFVSDRNGDFDVFHADRALTSDPFAAPTPAAELNSPTSENGVTLSADGRIALIASTRGGTGDIDLYRSARATIADPFSTPELIAGLKTPLAEADPTLTPDGQFLYFTSTRGGGNFQLWRVPRSCP